MSSDAIGWVYRHSPAKGAAFTVHAAMADSVNDQHHYEFWMKLGHLADKTRLSRPTVCAAVHWLEEHGLLVNIDAAQQAQKRPSRAVRYRLLMPSDQPIVWAPFDGDVRAPRGVKPDDTKVTTETTPGVKQGDTHRTQEEPKEEPNQLTPLPPVAASLPQRQPVGFEAFWATYPRREGRRAACKAWDVAITRAPWDVIVAGARRYADDPNRDPQFTAHPTTWLNQDRWEDDPQPPRNGAAPPGRMQGTMAAARRFIEADA